MRKLLGLSLSATTDSSSIDADIIDDTAESSSTSSSTPPTDDKKALDLSSQSQDRQIPVILPSDSDQVKKEKAVKILEIAGLEMGYSLSIAALADMHMVSETNPALVLHITILANLIFKFSLENTSNQLVHHARTRIIQHSRTITETRRLKPF